MTGNSFPLFTHPILISFEQKAEEIGGVAGENEENREKSKKTF